MIAKLFNILLRYNIKFPWFFYHFLGVIKLYIKNKGGLICRTSLDFSWSRTFLRYLLDPQKKELLYKNINDADRKFLDGILGKIEYVGNNNLLEYKKVFTKQDDNKKMIFLKSYFSYRKDGVFIQNECFNNLYFIPKTIEKLGINKENKFDILDCGGYIGDSGIVFSDLFQDSIVHVFEPEANNYTQLEKNIQLYQKVGKILPLNFAVGSIIGTMKISGTGAGATIGGDVGKNIHITTIDNYVFENDLNPGIIKWDIEGAEYDSILGAEKTIKKFKPILFISIYHSGKDFFEIKPLLESWNLGYKFTFDRWNCQTIFADTILIAY